MLFVYDVIKYLQHCLVLEMWETYNSEQVWFVYCKMLTMLIGQIKDVSSSLEELDRIWLTGAKWLNKNKMLSRFIYLDKI